MIPNRTLKIATGLFFLAAFLLALWGCVEAM